MPSSTLVFIFGTEGHEYLCKKRFNDILQVNTSCFLIPYLLIIKFICISESKSCGIIFLYLYYRKNLH